MRLCFGTYMKTLIFCKMPGISNKRLCSAVLLSVNPLYDISSDDVTVSNLINCKRNLSPIIIDSLLNQSLDVITDSFCEKVFPLLDSSKMKISIAAILDIISHDDLIHGDTILMSSSKKTKSELLEETSFSAIEFFSNIFWYVALNVKNIDGNCDQVQLDEHYWKEIIECSKKICLEADLKESIILTKTLYGKHFEDIFIELNHGQHLELPNPTQLRLFTLEMENNSFTYCALQDFVQANIGRYLFSRAQIDKYCHDDDVERIVLRAIECICGKFGHSSGDNNLGRFLIYAFLEHLLNAPKILISEDKNPREPSSLLYSDCIHLLHRKSKTLSKAYQLVFGVSSIENDMYLAVDVAFQRIHQITSNKKHEILAMERSLAERKFDELTAQRLEHIIIPGHDKDIMIDNAFGVFLGYTLQKPETLFDNLSYRKEIQELLFRNLQEITPYIMSKIQQYNLLHYSFYIYLLPFNDAIQDGSLIKHLQSSNSLPEISNYG